MTKAPSDARRREPVSLAARIAWMTSVWAMVATIVTASIVITVYRRSVNEDFLAVLQAHLTTLVAGVRSDGGLLQVPRSPAAGDTRFDQPGSGWYWSVEGLGEEPWGGALVASNSLGDAQIATPEDAPDFEGIDYRRQYGVEGPLGQSLRALETEVELDAEGRAARFRVFGNQSEIDDRVRGFARTLVIALGTFALGSVLVGLAVVRVGLRPLERVRASLQDVREGRAERIEAEAPREVRPLVDEVNALIAGNRRIVERARTQVGNLAHGLKTPLAVMLNEGRALHGETGRTLVEQAGRMRAQIDTYLDRARVAAGSRAGLENTDAAAVVRRVVGALRKLRKDRRFEETIGEGLRFAGEEHDLEEVAGNLIENAAKWARRTVWVDLEADGDRLRLTVQDDGPGLDPEAAERASRRGVRLDESVEGSGLGLSIVRDIVGEYDGTFHLERSEAGGLLARVTLPRKA